MTKILVIDDSDLVSKLLHEALTEAGYEVAVAADANQGYARAIEFQPDLILLDVHLPDVLGFDLIKVLRNRDELINVPIIMITGTHNQPEHRARAFKAGVSDYLQKPFEMHHLVERVSVALGRGASPSLPPPAAYPVSPPALAPVPVKQEIKPAPEPPMGRLSAAAQLPKTVPNPSGPPARPKAYSLPRALEILLLSPRDFPFQTPFPPASLAFLLTALALGFLGLAEAAGPAIKPAVFALVLTLSWVILVSVLVMACSVTGIVLHWKDGGRLFSLAMTPLILKLAGGAAASLWTSLSPFYFVAGPAVFLHSPSFVLERFDLFEGWSVGLLWWLLRHQPASTAKRAGIITGLVWLTGAALAMAALRLGK